MAKNKKSINKNNKIIVNNGLTEALDIPYEPYNSALNSAMPLFYNTSPHLITLNWTTLAYAYKSNGFIQTAINQIVDDAFRNDGLIIDSKTLDTDDMQLLRQTMEDEGDIEAIKDVIRWGQLYGGGVLIANTEQDPNLPLDTKLLYGEKLEFLASDRWQCIPQGTSPQQAKSFIFTDNLLGEQKTGMQIDRSRIGVFTGVKAPYF